MKYREIALDHSRRQSRREQILRLLCDGKAHSGEVIAKKLRISRTAVWKSIKALRSIGMDITSSRSDGYQFHQAVELYDPRSIASALVQSGLKPALHIEAFLTLDSTNRWLVNQSKLAAKPALCLAEMQSAGQGRRGRSWQSPFGSGLCMSLSWTFNEALSSPGSLSLVAGLAVVRALQSLMPAAIQLKWPNDVIYRGKKLGGILIELQGDVNGPARVVIGIGLNLQLPRELKVAIAQRGSLAITDLAAATEQLPSRNLIVAAITNNLIRLIVEYSEKGFTSFMNEWKRYDALNGASVQIITATETILGIAEGVDEDGALRVQTSSGLKTFYSGEVTLRPN
jgi:BirA family transcriptional regulator, biotin operon repressor / biotin---[acetyl-CoA-carboxylase] ligase